MLKQKYFWIGFAFLVVLLGYYFFWSPETKPYLFLKCPLYEVTGYQCPGCGSQRALHELLHGRMADAFQRNALFVMGLPYAGLLVFTGIQKERHPKLFIFLRSPMLIVFLILMSIIFGIVRNL